MTFTTWVMLEKNQTIYKYKLFDNTHLFDKDLMNLRIEGWNTDVKMDFNDIICIKTEDYFNERIISVPFSLRELSIKNTDLKEIPLFPKEIKSIQIINSKIEIDEEQMLILRNCYPSAKINITKITFMEKDWNQQRQAELNEAVANINHMIRRRDDNIMPGIHRAEDPFTDNILNDSQTVHISSINKCVIDAITLIKEESEKYKKVNDPLYCLFHEETEPKEKTFLGFIHRKICNLFKTIQKTRLEMSVQLWCQDSSRHSVHKLTFNDLFMMIMTIIMNHPSKEDMKERLKIELNDSIGLCFTGRINRMVNALVGFIDGIQIGLSVKEETQMRISMIVKRLMDKKIKKEEARKEMEELFEGLGKESNITENYKQANLLALEEFGDDDEDDNVVTNKNANTDTINDTNTIINTTANMNIFEGDLITFD